MSWMRLYLLAAVVCAFVASTAAGDECGSGNKIQGNNRGKGGATLTCSKGALACSTGDCSGDKCTATCCPYTSPIPPSGGGSLPVTSADCAKPVYVQLTQSAPPAGVFTFTTSTGAMIPYSQIGNLYLKATPNYCFYSTVTSAPVTPPSGNGPADLSHADFCYSPAPVTPSPSPPPPSPSPPPPSPSPPPPSPSPPPPSPSPPDCYECPQGFVKQPTSVPYGCAFVCVTPIKLTCMPPLSDPIICGGDTYKPCPTISCGYVSAYAVSGPFGCSQASSKVNSTAISASSYALNGYYTPVFKDFCTNIAGMTYETLAAKAIAATEAYASAIAYTLTDYNAYVCGCCSGNSVAYTVVASDVQSVASATAAAYAQGVAAVSDCYGNILSGASQDSYALAQSVNLAIDSVYQKYVAGAGQCVTDDVVNEIKYAVAKASVCVYAEAFAAASNNYYAANGISGKAYNCGTAIALSGSGGAWQQTCKVDYNC